MSSKRIILDVREPFEYQMEHIEGALNVPLSDLISGKSQLESIDKDTELIVYCRSGNRSSTAINILRQMGYTHLVNGISTDYVTKKYL